MKLRGMFWWIDRWRKSTAFIDLNLEEQGAYRNLLEEAWLRGGGIPDDPWVLARASGDAKRWAKVQPKVMAKFRCVDGFWHNETIDELLHDAQKNARKQRTFRQKVTGPLPVTRR